MEYNPLSMRPPEAIFCLRDADKLCVRGICPYHDDLTKIAQAFNQNMDKATEDHPGDPEAIERAAAEVLRETDDALGKLYLPDCRPVDPRLQ